MLFFEEKFSVKPEKLTFKNINKESICDFLDWLQSERQSSNVTRNGRLAAIHSFFRYLQSEDPKHLYCSQTILLIPYKKKEVPVLKCLNKEQTSSLLREPNLYDTKERRDAVILSILYDTGARVQEVCDLRMRDIRLESPAIITLTGKGNRSRNVPIVGNAVELLTNYIKEKRLSGINKLDYPLFFNQRGEPLTRGGITHILKKYTSRVKDINMPEKISPHILRHSKAMHLLQAGYNMIIIRDWLGHVSIKTTEIYARLDIDAKRKILEEAFPIKDDALEYPDWTENQTLMDFLKNL
jgi:site-specific recombinase XerD